MLMCGPNKIQKCVSHCARGRVEETVGRVLVSSKVLKKELGAGQGSEDGKGLLSHIAFKYFTV